MSFPNDYQTYIHLSKYSRWNDDLQRRETWNETVDRYIDFMFDEQAEGRFSDLKEEARDFMYGLKVMPSMRCVMTAGKALRRDNCACYNCSFIAIDSVNAFDEILYILMCGSGVGFSCERQVIAKLPEVPEELFETDTVINVADSKIGWAKAYKELVSLLFAGHIPKWDVSKVRPAGAKLKTFGGRASGPGCLVDLFQFTINVFQNATGRKLKSIEVHDIVCRIGETVVSGGVRRSALLSLSNLSDERMATAKSGEWWNMHPHRALANNSVAYTEKPEIDRFMKEWLSLMESKSGERGIFNREAAIKKVKTTRREMTEEDFKTLGCNPCSEIILKSRSFCNLSEVIIREDDTVESLKQKVRIAALFGTIQSTLTNFRYLSKKWKQNAEEERLLGVSLTGIMDNEITNGSNGDDVLKTLLIELKEYAIQCNKEFAERLGINPSGAITCVKPSGTVSQLVNSSSGIHPRYSQYYIRTVRSDIKDPITQMMIDCGFPNEPCHLKGDTIKIFSFPIKSPEQSVFRKQINAIEQLKIWEIYQDQWCEHKPSVTIYVKDHEWLEVGAWVYKNFDKCSGVSFLPYDNGTYRQAPYQEITEEQYVELSNEMPINVDWSLIQKYEKEDTTTGMREFACVGGSCEIA